jgi:putative DNA primase/helicase
LPSPSTSPARPPAIRPQQLAREFIAGRVKQPLVFWRGRWHEWIGTHYRKVPTAAIDSEVYQWLDERLGSMPGRPPLTTNRQRDVINVIRAFSVVPDELDPPFSLVNRATMESTVTFQNGVLSVGALLAGADAPLRPHTPYWFSTIALPFDYNRRASCPRWDGFLQEVFEGDQERIEFWMEWMGYCLIQDYRYQHAVILVGEGRNGKGVCLRTLERLLGKDNISHVPLDLFGKPFHLYNTLGKLANIAGEISGSDKAAEEYLKMYTGGDPIYVDIKHQPEGITLKPTARLIFACNEIPQFHDRSDGIRRRLIILPFNWAVPVERVDRGLENRLAEELPGIFNRAMEGLQRLTQRGEFAVPTLSARATARHLLESNTARLFLSEQTVALEGHDVSKQAIYERYVEHCRTFRLTPVLSNIQFGMEVARHYGGRVTSAQRRQGTLRQQVYRGLQLAQPAEPGELGEAGNAA